MHNECYCMPEEKMMWAILSPLGEGCSSGAALLLWVTNNVEPYNWCTYLISYYLLPYQGILIDGCVKYIWWKKSPFTCSISLQEKSTVRSYYWSQWHCFVVIKYLTDGSTGLETKHEGWKNIQNNISFERSELNLPDNVNYRLKCVSVHIMELNMGLWASCLPPFFFNFRAESMRKNHEDVRWIWFIYRLD